MPSLLLDDDQRPLGGGLLGLGAPRIEAADVTPADAADVTAQQVGDFVGKQRAISEQRGLWSQGGPTAAGLLDAAQQYGQGLLLGTTAPKPGFTAFHGSPSSFERFDSSKLHPDEAGHYFAQDEGLAKDYAGRSSRDPTAGNMYEVNIKADPAQFLDYGKMSAAEQAALNDPGAVQKLKDAGVPGITFPDRTHVVFNDANIEILRKYGLAGLMAGGGAAAAGGNP